LQRGDREKSKTFNTEEQRTQRRVGKQRAKSKANPTARRRRRVLRQDKGEFVGVFCFTVFEGSGGRFV